MKKKSFWYNFFSPHLCRPSPERLDAQLRSVEQTQERIVEIMTENNKAVIEEIKNHRQTLLEELKSNRQNTVDLKIEVKQGLHDLKMEMSKVCNAIRDSAQAQQAFAAQAAARGSGSSSSGNDLRSEAAIQALNKDLSQVLASLPRQIANAMPVPPPPQVIHQQAAPAPPPPPAPPAPEVAVGKGGLTLAEMQVRV